MSGSIEGSSYLCGNYLQPHPHSSSLTQPPHPALCHPIMATVYLMLSCCFSRLTPKKEANLLYKKAEVRSKLSVQIALTKYKFNRTLSKNPLWLNVESDAWLCLVFIHEGWGQEDKKHVSEYVIVNSSFLCLTAQYLIHICIDIHLREI